MLSVYGVSYTVTVGSLDFTVTTAIPLFLVASKLRTTALDLQGRIRYVGACPCHVFALQFPYEVIGIESRSSAEVSFWSFRRPTEQTFEL